MRIDVGTEVVLKPRDTIMLASDGLMDNVHFDEIIDRIRSGPLDEAANRVISLAQLGVEALVSEELRDGIKDIPADPTHVKELVANARRCLSDLSGEALEP